MSDKTQNPVITVVNDENETTQESTPTRRQRARTFVTKHKKPLIAAGLFAGVVGLASLTGRKSAVVTVQSPLELDVVDYDDEFQDENDSVTA